MLEDAKRSLERSKGFVTRNRYESPGYVGYSQVQSTTARNLTYSILIKHWS